MSITSNVSYPAFENKGSGKSGTGCLILFALPFALVGLFVLGWVGKDLLEYYDMKSWTPVDAIVTSAELETHYGDDSTTYKAVATYEYEYEGIKHKGSRVGITSGADNLGSFHQDAASTLENHLRSKEPITIYVNPKDPSDSIVFRELRIGQFAFMGIFGLIFSTVGLGLMIGALFSSKEQKVREVLKKKYPGEPWRSNPKWQTGTLKTGNKGQFVAFLIFGSIWNLISMPLLVFLPEEVFKKGNYIAALGFLFPLIGVFLLIAIYRSFVQWRKFGGTTLTLNPFPPEIGGEVRGTLKISAQMQSGTKDAKGKIKCSRTEKRRTSKGGTSTTSVEIWSKDFPLVIESFRTMSSGTAATFKADLAGVEAPPTDEEAYEPITWSLEFTADIPGVDFFATFDIPVIKRAV